MELISHHRSIESARNAAIDWLEARGVRFGPHRDISVGRLGTFQGHEVGVEAGDSYDGPFWRLRIDYDPVKQVHFNAEHGRGEARAKAAFLFPAGPRLLERLVRQRAPR